uniref:uncharacterized mitochondrial protein AtMg00810-like n=1 Tax=Erigeron canadensis TaxID=72917 RepID=UPI001CB9140B|nr:uncharacterized mitochondrial protein AtMg00810-like [Erigeron canadensis]
MDTRQDRTSHQTGVDDIPYTELYLRIQSYLQTDLGRLKYFLGIEVLDTKEGICLSQRKYCLEVLNEFGLLGYKPPQTPLEQNMTIFVKESEDDKLLGNITEYQKLIGKLIYLTLTRPDISNVVQCLSQFMHSPLESHLKWAFRILRYLNGAPGKGIHIKQSDTLTLRAYVDSDWGRCLNSKRSVTGYCVYLGNSLVSWRSKKQNIEQWPLSLVKFFG